MQRLLNVCGCGLGTPDLAVGFGELASEPLHLSREQILGHGAGVVGAQELLSLVLGLLLLTVGSLEVVARFAFLLGQLAADRLLNVGTERWAQAEPQVEGLNGFLDALDPDGWPGAPLTHGVRDEHAGHGHGGGERHQVERGLKARLVSHLRNIGLHG
ncbi:hypothetical protein OHS18_42005 [Amycolatopsis sp. NBC_00355]|uniref:hypothetical protein n=1 Tax=Amycolatopsis sp. NBC_00355 TaxID=2975957 RepID=UPI002E25F9EC